jgi:hypothetical protein
MLTATPAPKPGRIGQPDAAKKMTERLRRAAERLVSAESVAATRILFGLIVMVSSVRFIAKGWVGRLWIEPATHLTYPGLGWVQPLPGAWMYVLPVVTAVAGLAIALGWRHRLATGVFLIAFTWTELIDAALYLNHYWFLTLLGVLMLVLPVHQHWSLDACGGRVDAQTSVPAVTVWALRAQVGVVYVFAGLAKLNSDWLLRGQPLQLWLSDRSDVPLVGPLLDIDAVAFLASWGAAAFDLTIVGWLLWRRSRAAAWAVLVTFHLVTGALFQIGVFPLVMGVMALVFFEPDWPSSVIRRPSSQRSPASFTPAATRLRPWVLLTLVLLVTIQLALPLRHFAEPGNVRWNEDGYHLAWRVMLTEKAGFVDYWVTDATTGQTWIAKPNDVLDDWQIAHASTRPDFVHATALLLEQELRTHRTGQLEIRVDAWVSMNGRPAARLINPEVDLLAYERGALPNGTVLPMPRNSD